MNKLWYILIAFLGGLSIFSVFQYRASIQEKYNLRASVEKMQAEIAAIQNEKLGLEQSLDQEKTLNGKLTLENTQLSDDLKENEEKLAKLDADFKETLKKVEELHAQISTLHDQKESVTLQLAQATQEKDMLRARMDSIPELKKMIKELKKQMQQTTQEVKAKVKEERIILGNQGYLIRDGKPTYPPRVRIEVEPISQ